MAKKPKKKAVKPKDAKGATKVTKVKVKVASRAQRAASKAAKQAKAKQSKQKQSATASKVKAKAKATGLHLSAAQWRAYDSAYNAVEKSGHAQLDSKVSAQYAAESLQLRRAAIASAAASLQKSRLGAANSMQKKAAAAQAAASTASIALFAVRMSLRQSHLAQQNIALQQRVYADFERHLQVYAHKQYAAGGEKAFAHEAVMRTLTTKEAVTLEEARFARAVKTAKAASRVAAKTAVKNKRSAFTAAIKAEVKAADAVINANAKAAGLKAARAVPAPRKARRPGKCKPALEPSWWFGHPDGEDCVTAAVANSLLLQLGQRLARTQYADMRRLIPAGASIAGALDLVMTRWPEMGGYDGSWEPRELRPGMIVGFPTENGPHAALLLGGQMIASWGEVLPLEEAATGPVEEAYEAFWRDVRWLRGEPQADTGCDGSADR